MSALLGTLVAHSLWQGLVVWLVVLGADPVLRRSTPAAKCRFDLLALASLPVATIVTLALLQTSPPVHPVSRALAPGWLVTLGWVWMLGAGVGTVRLSVGVVGTWRLRRSSSAAPAWLLELLERSCLRIGLDKPPRAALSDAVAGPCVVGVLRPMILVPSAAITGLAPEQLEMLLLHELAHLRRFDPVLNAMQSVIEVLYFFHPVTHWLSARARAEREHACDELAVRDRRDRITLARGLLSLAQPPTRVATLAATGGTLMTRIHRLLHSQRPQRPSRRAWLLSTVLLATLGTGLTLFACEVAPAPDSPEARVAPYVDMVAEAADRYELPESLIVAVIAAESNFDPDAVSPRGAAGLMQLMPQTAELMGVEDPLDPRQNIFGGAKYLRLMLDRFDGDLTLATAAYNAGPTAVEENWSVPQNGETPEYVERVIAVHIDLHRGGPS